MAKGVRDQNKVVVLGKTFYWSNDPHTGKLDMFDSEGNHIGEAPNLDEIKKFLTKEIQSGRLASYNRMSARVAQRWMNIVYPMVTCDADAQKYFKDAQAIVEKLFNKLPKKAKDVLKDAEYHVCFGESIDAMVNHGVPKDQQESTGKILGLTKPSEQIIMLNLERFSDAGTKRLSEEAFENLFFHESGHYLVHHFTDEEKSVYYKYFGAEPIMVGEPEADSFAAYMRGIAPYHVQEFWAWWVLKDY